MNILSITYKFCFSIMLIWCVTGELGAQINERAHIRKGNRLYRDTVFQKSEVEYRKAIELKAGSSRALYNLGNSLLMQQKAKDAMKMYESAVTFEKNKTYKAQMYHNMGVILQSQKQFAEAIECYKHSLRNNPHDDQTRYNLVLCQRQQKNQPDNSDQKKQDQQQNKNQENQESKKDTQEQKKQQQKQEKDQISKNNAEQMLKAAQQEEKRTQDKVNKRLQESSPRRLEKNW